MTNLKLRKVLNKLPKSVTKQNAFSTDFSALKVVEYVSYREVAGRIFITCRQLDDNKIIEVVRDWKTGGSIKDPSFQIVNRLKSGDTLVLKDLNDDGNLKFGNLYPVYKSEGNIDIKFYENKPFFIDKYNEFQDVEGKIKRSQKYYLINTEKSVRVSSSKEAVQCIRDVLINGKLNDTFMIRGYSSEEKIALSFICKENNDFKDKRSNFANLFSKFVQEQHNIEMTSFEVEKTKMTGADLLSLVDEDPNTVWEIIPVTYYQKNLMPQNNPSLEVSLMANAETLSSVYQYENVDAFRNTFLGIKTIEYKPGKFYSDIVAPHYSNTENPLPLSLVATKFANPKFSLGYSLEIESESKYVSKEEVPDGVSLLEYALSLDESGSAQDIEDNFDFSAQFSQQNELKDSLNISDLSESIKEKDIFDEIIDEYQSSIIGTINENNIDESEEFDDEFDIDAIELSSSSNSSDFEDDDFEDEFDIDSIDSMIEDNGNNLIRDPLLNTNSATEETGKQSSSEDTIHSDIRRRAPFELPPYIKEGMGRFMMKKLIGYHENENGIVMNFTDPMSESKMRAAVRNLGLHEGSFQRIDANKHEYFLELKPKNSMNLATEDSKYSEDMSASKDDDDDDIMSFLKDNLDTLNKSMGI